MLISIGLALKWTQPVAPATPEQTAFSEPADPTANLGPAHDFRLAFALAQYPILSSLSDELRDSIVQLFTDGGLQTVDTREVEGVGTVTLASVAQEREWNAKHCGHDSQGLCLLFVTTKNKTRLVGIFDGSRSSPRVDPGDIALGDVVKGKNGNVSLLIDSFFAQSGGKDYETGYVIDLKTGDRETIGKMKRDGDDVTLSFGEHGLAAHYDRVADGSAASSILFTDDSTTQITISGSWEAPDIRLDLARTFAAPSSLVFSLGAGDGTDKRLLYLYDAAATTERLSLVE